MSACPNTYVELGIGRPALSLAEITLIREVVKKRIEEMRDVVGAKIYTAELRSADELRDIPLMHGLDYDVSDAMKQTVMRVYNRLHNRKEVLDYVEKLMVDAAENTLARGSAREVEMLRRGQIARHATLRVLVDRARARGEKPGTVASMNFEEFQRNVRSGPFFDRGLANAQHSNPEVNAYHKILSVAHGVDSHFIQRDMVADVVANGVGPTEFYRIVGTTDPAEGEAPYWGQIFDVGRGHEKNKDFSSPEGIRTQLHPFLGNE